jgi:hypothetical protein
MGENGFLPVFPRVYPYEPKVRTNRVLEQAQPLMQNRRAFAVSLSQAGAWV